MIKEEQTLKTLSILAIIMLTIGLHSTEINPTAYATSCTRESEDLWYQLSHANRVVLGRVAEIREYPTSTLVGFEVVEWLKNPLPHPQIWIHTPRGYQAIVAGAMHFQTGEEFIINLGDMDLAAKTFSAMLCLSRKYPVSMRGEILNILGASPDSTRDVGVVSPPIIENPTSPVITLLTLIGVGLLILLLAISIPSLILLRRQKPPESS